MNLQDFLWRRYIQNKPLLHLASLLTPSPPPSFHLLSSSPPKKFSILLTDSTIHFHFISSSFFPSFAFFFSFLSVFPIYIQTSQLSSTNSIRISVGVNITRFQVSSKITEPSSPGFDSRIRNFLFCFFFFVSGLDICQEEKQGGDSDGDQAFLERFNFWR